MNKAPNDNPAEKTSAKHDRLSEEEARQLIKTIEEVEKEEADELDAKKQQSQSDEAA